MSKTNVRSTSLEAYRREILPTLGHRQNQVLYVFYEYPNIKDFTDKELSRKLGWEINTVVPRRNELVKLGVLIESCKRKCSVTKRRVLAWKMRPYPVEETGACAQGRV